MRPAKGIEMLMSTRSEVALPDEGLLNRFDIPGPRYTSYPTADRFVEAFDRHAFAEALRARATGVANNALSLYVHLPFCNTVCYYCGCNKVITKDRSKSAEYVGYIAREADLVLEHLTGSRTIEQLHFGGGTPTFASNEELEQLMAELTKRFPLEEKGEFSIEVDPRTTPPDKVETLGRLGFNRISVGVQDFNPDVQKAVNRLQSFEMTQATVDAARRNGFKSINLDLIYGLPKQTRETFAETPTSPGGIRFAAQTAPISVAPGPKISNCHTSFASPTVRHSPLSPYPYFSANSPMIWMTSRAVDPRSSASRSSSMMSKSPSSL
jgi:oxygen-independent coproporphyrinogen-3 oxidase